MTYEEVRAVLGLRYVTHVWRQPRLEECIAEVQGLARDCADKGLQSRAEAYNAVAAAMAALKGA